MHIFKEEGYISRIYYESMRDNFEGYAWDLHPDSKLEQESNQQKTDQLNALRDEFDELDPLKGAHPTLGQLFKIELALVWLVPEAALRARFWTIEDRFHRVVPTSVAQSYRSSFTSQPIEEVSDEVLRQRARNLLDVIHANYLINLARENSIKRMMTILGVMAFAILIGSLSFVWFSAELAVQGLVAIMVAGMFGAMISIIQRLQKATSRDAMVEDGIFELIGLRVGWVSVLMSIGIGGVFALFIYVLISGNLFDQLLPHSNNPLGDSGGGALGDAGGGDLVGLDVPQAAAPDIETADAPGNPSAMTGDTGAGPVAEDDRAAALADTNPPTRGPTCPKLPICPADNDRMWVDQVRTSLGLTDRIDFYKMIATAFISGFAERFVPDIINKLGKQNPVSATGSAPGAGGGNPTI
ncbi:hypothetical protein C7451_11140 [Blastomonas natatoria]|uniref:Uncharacterized protein n=1 Tax=Blastomonas natatoria TaxID=34015 RepID=A0A2V3V855_9SPHN|nr:hypothetical protein [Blastomonas natatoria]PXW72919.1 hypothetical protein C7451_11140 [Blastomonas natatoria]